MRLCAFLVALLLLAGCSSPSIEQASLPPMSTVTRPAESATSDSTHLAGGSSAETATTRPVSPLATMVEPAGSAIPSDASERTRSPVSLTVGSIGVTAAPIVPVGVLEDGQMEIPGRSEVGWYRFGAVPGSAGSAVLAAHIAFDGRAGVFRNLSRIELGDVLSVAFEYGSMQRYEVFELAQYDKAEVPFERVFAREGDSVLVLISCGGIFDRSAGSYEDNIVAYARPLGPK